MKTKIVFVLTSKDTDIYLEQLWVSLYSLRKLMPVGEAHVVLITDTITEATFVGYRQKLLLLVDEKIVVELDSNMSGLQRSRWLKTKSRDLVEGDMLYIDSDTIFVGRLDELDNLDCELGAVKDCHVGRINTSCSWDMPKGEMFINDCKKLGFDPTVEEVTYNGGMIYAKDSQLAHRFFDEWHREWLVGKEKGLNTDQPSFTRTNIVLNHPISEISGIWNCQIVYGIKYLSRAKILHYFATGISKKKTFPYWFMNNFIYEDVKKKGDITDEVKEALGHPLDLFEDDTKILVGEETRVASSRPYFYALYLYKHKQGIFRLLDKMLRIVSRFRVKYHTV